MLLCVKQVCIEGLKAIDCYNNMYFNIIVDYRKTTKNSNIQGDNFVLSTNTNRQLLRQKRKKKFLVIYLLCCLTLGLMVGTTIYYRIAYKKEAVNKEVIGQNPKDDTSKVEDFINKPLVGEKNSTSDKEEDKKEDKSEDNKEDKKEDNNGNKEAVNYQVNVEEIYKKDGVRNVFLTFDDGPTTNITPQILEILDSYQVKATFFVLGKQAEANPDILKTLLEKGHAVGMHSYSHNYDMYKSIELFNQDLDLCVRAMKNVLGQDFSTRLYRFPGGSGGRKQIFKDRIKEANLHYIDWTALTGDSEPGENKTPEQLLARLKESIVLNGNPEDVVVLMHDSATKQISVEALPAVIDYFKSQNFNFMTMK